MAKVIAIAVRVSGICFIAHATYVLNTLPEKINESKAVELQSHDYKPPSTTKP